MSPIPLAPYAPSTPNLYSATHFDIRQASLRRRSSLWLLVTSLVSKVSIVSQWLKVIWARTCARPFEAAPFRIRILFMALVLAGLVVSILLFIRLRTAPSESDTQTHCNRRATQLQAIFDVQAISLVRHISAFLSAIGTTSILDFTQFVALLRPDNTTVSGVTLYQRVEQRHRAQWVSDYAEELKPGNRNEIWTLPTVTVRPVHVAEMWPCIASIPISDTALEAGKVFPFIGFDPLGEPTRAAPLLRALRPEQFGKPSMSSLIRYPNDGSLGFNIYARNLQPVKTKSKVTDEVAIGAHFVVKDLFRGMWTVAQFDYVVRASTVELLRTSTGEQLLNERAVSLDVTIIDQRIQLQCFPRPDFGVFAYRYGAYFAASASVILSLCFASLVLQVHHRLAHALESRGDLDVARSLIKSLQGRAQAILMAIDVPVAVVDVFGRMIPLNDPAREWMGGTASSVEGVNVSDVIELPAHEPLESPEALADGIEISPPMASNVSAAPAADVRQASQAFSSPSSPPVLPPSTANETCLSDPLPPTRHSRRQRPNRAINPPLHNPLIQSIVVASSVSLPNPTEQAKSDDGQLPFRPGTVQVNVRRPADGIVYPAEVSASRPFTVPRLDFQSAGGPAARSTATARSDPSLFRRMTDHLCRLRATARVRGDTELGLVDHTPNSSSTVSSESVHTQSSSSPRTHHQQRQCDPSSSVRRRQRTPLEPHMARTTTAHATPSSSSCAQQMILITDRSEAAERAHKLESAQAELAAAHQACTEMLLLLCHELRNPAHVVSGLLANTDPDTQPDPNAPHVTLASSQLARYLDHGALLLGQETDSHVPGLPVRNWALVELVRTVCRHRLPAGLDAALGPPNVYADAHVLRMAPMGDADHWQRMVRIMLGLAVDLGGGSVTRESVMFVLSPAWEHTQHLHQRGDGGPLVIPSQWRVRLDIRILVLPSRSDDDRARVAQSLDDMQRVIEWTQLAAAHWSAAEQDAIENVPRSAPIPPDPITWAGLHILVLWRQMWAMCGRDPKLMVSVERQEDTGWEVIIVALDVECHLVQ